MLIYGPGDVANRLQSDTVVRNDGKSTGIEDVDVTTIDAFCERYRIDFIDYLKIDAEGHDLDVLHGADGMLTSQRCGIVQVECGMNPTPAKHIGYAELDSYLRNKGFVLFGIYMQANGDPARPVLTHADWVFVGELLLRHPLKPVNVSALPASAV